MFKLRNALVLLILLSLSFAKGQTTLLLEDLGLTNYNGGSSPTGIHRTGIKTNGVPMGVPIAFGPRGFVPAYGGGAIGVTNSKSLIPWYDLLVLNGIVTLRTNSVPPGYIAYINSLGSTTNNGSSNIIVRTAAGGLIDSSFLPPTPAGGEVFTNKSNHFSFHSTNTFDGPMFLTNASSPYLLPGAISSYSIDYVNGWIIGTNGYNNPVFNISTAEVNDLAGFGSVQAEYRQLYDRLNGNASIDWDLRVLYDAGNVAALNWSNFNFFNTWKFNSILNMGQNRVTNGADAVGPLDLVTFRQMTNSAASSTNGLASTNYVNAVSNQVYTDVLATVWAASQYPQALLTNGSRPMRAPLNMGGNPVTNMQAGVNPLDAVNVSQLGSYLTTNGNGSGLTGVLHAPDTNNLPNRTEMNAAIGGATNGAAFLGVSQTFTMVNNFTSNAFLGNHTLTSSNIISYADLTNQLISYLLITGTNNLPNRTEMNAAIAGATNGHLPASAMSGFVTEGPTGVTTGNLAGASINLLNLQKLGTNLAPIASIMWFNGTFWTNAMMAAIPPLVIETNASGAPIRVSIVTNGNANQYLSGDGTFSTPAGSSGGGNVFKESNNVWTATTTQLIPRAHIDVLASSGGTAIASLTSTGLQMNAQMVALSGTIPYTSPNTCVWNCAAIQKGTLTLTNNVTLILSNYWNYGEYIVTLVQDSAFKHLVTLSPSNNFKFANGILGAGFVPTTNAAGARDVVHFYIQSTGDVFVSVYRNPG